MIRNLRKVGAFLKRDLLTDLSYRLAFLMQVGGIFLGVFAFYYLSKMMDPETEGLDGIPPFDYLLVGMAFQFYFTSALHSFSARIRGEQMLGTLEAMLVAPTPTSLVIFSSAAWDFTYGAFRVVIYLLAAKLMFGVELHLDNLGVLVLGLLLTLLSSAGLGILSASFILYFKRGDPINFLLSGATTLLGTVFIPAELLPSWLQGVSGLLPVTRALAVIRGSLLQGKGIAELDGDLAVLAILTVVLLPLGLVASRIAIRRAKREGSLVQY